MDIVSVFHRAVRRYSDRRFLFDRHGRKVTYAEADAISEDVAWKLRTFYGVQQNSPVGFYSSDRVSAWLAVIAVWKLGALPAMVDSRATIEQLSHFLRPIQARMFVSCKDIAHNLKNLVNCPIVDLENLENKNWSPTDEADEGHSQEAVNGRSHLTLHHSGSPLYCSFTSGSTGPPKAAMVLSGPVTLGTACIAERLALTCTDVMLATTPMTSSFQLVSCVMPAMHVGACVGLLAGASCGEIWTTAKPHRSPVLVAYPLTLGDMLASAPPCCEPGAPPAGEAPPSTAALVARPGTRPPFRVALSGGSPLAPRIKRDFWRLLGVRLLESYGQSELGGFMAMGSLFDAVDECGPESVHRSQHGPHHHHTNLPPFYPRGPPASVRGVAGKPLPDRPAILVYPWQTKEEREGAGGSSGGDKRGGEGGLSTDGDVPTSLAARMVAAELSVAQLGEVVVPFGYFQGYIGMSEATAVATRGGVLHTGDLAVTDADGGIKVMGRMAEREMALVRAGFLRELEDAMYEHDGVRHAVVVEDASGKGVVCYVELHSVARASVTPKVLRDFVARPEVGLPAGLVPAYVRMLDTIPRTFSGKADRAALATMDWP